jgi:hypothetical protein
MRKWLWKVTNLETRAVYISKRAYGSMSEFLRCEEEFYLTFPCTEFSVVRIHEVLG